MIERQEIHCHDCNQYVQFNIDTEINGNHVLNCPNCGHEHCRVVRNGQITDIRWDSRNGPTWPVSSITITSSSVSAVYTTGITASSAMGHYFISSSWLNSVSGT